LDYLIKLQQFGSTPPSLVSADLAPPQTLYVCACTSYKDVRDYQPGSAAIEGQWLHTKVYRIMTVVATTAEAQEAAERLRRLFDFAHLRG